MKRFIPNFFLRRQASDDMDQQDVKPACPDKGPWVVAEWVDGYPVVLKSQDPTNEAWLPVLGFFSSHDQNLFYAHSLADWMNSCAESAEFMDPNQFFKPATATPSDCAAMRIDRPDLEGGEADVLLPEAFDSSAQEQVALPVVDTSAEISQAPTRAVATSVAQGEKKGFVGAITRLISSSSHPTISRDRPAVVRTAEPAMEPTTEVTSVGEVQPSPAPMEVLTPHQQDSAAISNPATNEGVNNIKYGCHCELEPGQEPDACVLDYNQPQYCVYAQAQGATKEKCGYWQPVKVYKQTK